jgi:hypothetical protein
MRDRLSFAKLISGLAVALGRELSEAAIEIYWNALARFSDEQINEAINAAAQTCKFFPKPVELIELVEGNREERATAAWDSLLTAIQRHGNYASVMFEDPKIARCVQMMGGWGKVCQTPVEDTKWACIEFVKLYRSLTHDPPAEKLIGITEQSLANGGHEDRIPKPRFIPCLSRHVGLARIGQPVPAELIMHDDDADMCSFVSLRQ